MVSFDSIFGLAMDFTIEKFLETMKNNMINWGGYITIIIGAVMMIVCLWKIGKGFFSDRAQTNWVMAIGGIVLGGLLVVGGWGWLQNTANSISTELLGYGGIVDFFSILS